MDSWGCPTFSDKFVFVHAGIGWPKPFGTYGWKVIILDGNMIPGVSWGITGDVSLPGRIAMSHEQMAWEGDFDVGLHLIWWFHQPQDTDKFEQRNM